MIGALGIAFLFPVTVLLIAGDYVLALICGIISLICFMLKIMEARR